MNEILVLFDKYDLQVLNQSDGKVGWLEEPQLILIVVLFFGMVLC